MNKIYTTSIKKCAWKYFSVKIWPFKEIDIRVIIYIKFLRISIEDFLSRFVF